METQRINGWKHYELDYIRIAGKHTRLTYEEIARNLNEINQQAGHSVWRSGEAVRNVARRYSLQLWKARKL